MLRKTEKMKSSNRTASVHERFINLNNSTLEKKVMKIKWKIFKKNLQVLNFAVLKKIFNFPGIYIHGRPY